MSRVTVLVFLAAISGGCSSTQMAMGIFATGEIIEGARGSGKCKTETELFNKRALNAATIKNVAVLVAPLHQYSYDLGFAEAPLLTFDLQQNLQGDVRDWFDLADIDSILPDADWVQKNTTGPKYCPLNYEIRHEAMNTDAVLEIEPVFLGFLHPATNKDRNEKGIGPEVILLYQLKSSKDGRVLIRSYVFFSTFTHYMSDKIPGSKVVGPRSLRFDNAQTASSQPEKMMKSIRYALKAVAREVVLVISENNRNVQGTAVELLSSNSDSSSY